METGDGPEEGEKQKNRNKTDGLPFSPHKSFNGCVVVIHVIKETM